MTELDKMIKAVTKNGVGNEVYSNEDAEDTYTIVEKLNAVLKYLQAHPDEKGSVVKVAGVTQEIIDFINDPQTQLDQLEDYCNSLDSTKADTTSVTNLETKVNDIDANKQDYFTYKYEGDFVVNDIDDFRTKVYEQRKNTVRKWQLEINPFNVDLMSILGYPDDGISSADKAFLYIELPYSEAGGFEIDLKLMKRDGSRIFTRTMVSTLNANWKDSGWMSTEGGSVADAIKNQSSFEPSQVKFNSNTFVPQTKVHEVLALNGNTIMNVNVDDLAISGGGGGGSSINVIKGTFNPEGYLITEGKTPEELGTLINPFLTNKKYIFYVNNLLTTRTSTDKQYFICSGSSSGYGLAYSSAFDFLKMCDYGGLELKNVEGKITIGNITFGELTGVKSTAYEYDFGNADFYLILFN